MKLHISSTLVSSHREYPPDRQGLLFKKSSRTTSYQPCWCELRGNLLFYRERYGDREPLRLIILEGCTVELQDSDSKPYTFEISYPFGLPGSRSYKMAAENQETMESWVRALTTAGFENLRALATELKGQFQELMSQQLPKVEGCSATGHKLPPPRFAEDKESLNLDFPQLHQKFGEDIVQLRCQWLEEREGKKHPEGNNLIDLGEDHPN